MGEVEGRDVPKRESAVIKKSTANFDYLKALARMEEELAQGATQAFLRAKKESLSEELLKPSAELETAFESINVFLDQLEGIDPETEQAVSLLKSTITKEQAKYSHSVLANHGVMN